MHEALILSAHKWQFTARFRRHAFGWRSEMPIQRIKETIAEIKQVARKEPVVAAEGAITLLEKLTSAFAGAGDGLGLRGGYSSPSIVNERCEPTSLRQRDTANPGERSYPIYIGGGLLGRADLLAPHIPGRQVMVVSNETVAPLYLDKIRAALRDFQCDGVILPDGEQHKTLEVMNRIFDALLAGRHDRGTTLVALGGGVIGDITGFAAACYQRGAYLTDSPNPLFDSRGFAVRRGRDAACSTHRMKRAGGDGADGFSLNAARFSLVPTR